MLVIQTNTEQRLLEDLQAHWEQNPKMRCGYIKFSQINQSEPECRAALLDALREYDDLDVRELYACYDGDVFLVSRTLTMKRFQKFLAYLSPKLEVSSLREGASLFELGVDWGVIRDIGIKKLEEWEFQEQLRRNRERKKSGEVMESVSRDQMLKSIDEALLASLSRRRKERHKPEVMIVEDDLFSQKLVMSSLEKRYATTAVGDGQGGIMSYVNRAPDVLFLDIGLPDMNGHKVLEKIFELDPSAYVVMLSANGDRENIVEAVKRGAKGFVGKPFTKDKLIQYIEKSPFIKEKQIADEYDRHSVH